MLPPNYFGAFFTEVTSKIPSLTRHCSATTGDEAVLMADLEEVGRLDDGAIDLTLSDEEFTI